MPQVDHISTFSVARRLRSTRIDKEVWLTNDLLTLKKVLFPMQCSLHKQAAQILILTEVSEVSGLCFLVCRLVMGTRCGDLDPAVVLYIQNLLGKSTKEMDSLMNKQSGLLGLFGKNDVRTILEGCCQNDERAQLAMDVSGLTQHCILYPCRAIVF